MDIALLVLVFLAALTVSACVVAAFSAPMDGLLLCLLNQEMAAAWAKYAKFAVFVSSLTAGLRLKELEAVAALTQPSSGPPVGLNQCLLEVYKTVAGTLTGASYTLLIFFGATLAGYAAFQAYDSFKRASRQTRADEHRSGVAAGRY